MTEALSFKMLEDVGASVAMLYAAAKSIKLSGFPSYGSTLPER